MVDLQYQLKQLKSMNIKHTFPNIETALQNVHLTMSCPNIVTADALCQHSNLKRVNTILLY